MKINIPNILTITRILLTPLFVICLLKEMFLEAMIIFIFAGISDGLDGFIARYFNQRTVLGAYLDPIADKLLLISAFITLSILKMVPSWLTVITLSRDVVILIGFAVITIIEIKVEIKPTIVSKCTTLAQLICILSTLLNKEYTLPFFNFIDDIIFGITALLTVVSGLHYIYRGMNILQSNQ